jgi:uncharacterized protein YkwD
MPTLCLADHAELPTSSRRVARLHRLLAAVVAPALVLVLAAAMVAGSAGLASAATAGPVLDHEEAAFCRTINTYRAQHGLAPLQVSTVLTRAAGWDTANMTQKNYFSHTDSLGRDPFKRMAAFGYTNSPAEGENIAAGSATAAGTFSQWQNSAPHNQNMLTATYKVIGISRSYSATATYGWYWNTDFGATTGSAVPCPSN